MRRTAAALLLSAVASLVGCGVQQVLLGTEGEYFYGAFDGLALPGEEVALRARLQGGDLLGARSGYVVRFLRDGRLFKAAETDGDGVATVSFTPPATGDYDFTAELSPRGFPDDPPAPRDFTVVCRPADTPMIVVDMDKTVVASGFQQVLIGDPEPMPNSQKVMQRLPERYTVVYLTHRPDYFGPKSKAWLRRHRYPSGPLLLSDIGGFLRGSGAFKDAALSELRGKFKRIEIGVGDKVSDAQAYHDNGLKAFLIVQIPQAADAASYEAMDKDLAALADEAQVVTDWRQIADALAKKASYPRSAMQQKLKALAAEAKANEKTDRGS